MPVAKTPEQKLNDKIALAAAEMLPPKKDLSNPAFKGTKYAGLAQVAAVIEPVLLEYKLSHQTFFEGRNIVYRVWDMETGAEFRSSLEMPLDNLSGNVWQGIGQGITYLRRYVMVAFWNLIPEDDDGNSAPRRETPQRTTEEVVAAVQSGGSL